MEECESLRSKDCNDLFTTDGCRNDFQPRAVLNTRNLMEESLNCSSKELNSLNCCASLAKHIFVTTRFCMRQV